MDAFTIKDLENLTGIKAHTIRIWEQRYGFLRPKRTNTNIRYYSNTELKAVLNIALLNKYGYKISHISRMTTVDISQKVLSLTHETATAERVINELIQNMVDLEMEAFELVLSKSIASTGLEKTISQVIFPFLERIGVLWTTNHINPAQEHLVTNIIRQKLILAIEHVSTSISYEKTAILFLPEGEHHELGLLYMYYLLKKRGVQVFYLGANVPVKDVAFVASLKKPHFLFTHFSISINNTQFEKLLSKVTLQIPTIPFIISGRTAQEYSKPVPDSIKLTHSIQEVLANVALL